MSNRRRTKKQRTALPSPAPAVKDGEAVYHIHNDPTDNQMYWKLDRIMLELPSVDNSYMQLVRVPLKFAPKDLVSEFVVNSVWHDALFKRVEGVRATDKSLHVPLSCNFELRTHAVK